MTKPPSLFSRNVWLLSLVSLCTDMASEMLYPVMPVFLKHIGYSVILIGMIEGMAEAIAGLSKSYFGHRSDQLKTRLPFIRIGYSLSAISKPLMALFTYPYWILFTRIIDRFGKGIRTAARDAMLSDESTKASKAKVFGLHRGLDTVGAVVGPLISLVFLYFFPQEYGMLFLIAFLPGMLAIFITFLLKERKEKKEAPYPIKTKKLFAFLNYWKESPKSYKKLVGPLILIALVNSSDIFLLLRLKECGASDTLTILLYIGYNCCYAAAAFPAGKFADSLGMKKVFVTGWMIFIAVYAGFSVTTNLWHLAFLLAAYGLFAAMTEGIAKAWISNLVPPHETGAAIGTYTGLQSLGALLASTVAGILWQWKGSSFSLSFTAVVVGLAIIALMLRTRNERII